MSKPPRIEPERETTPKQFPETVPQSYPESVQVGWLTESMMQMQSSVGELKARVEQLRSNEAEHQRDVKSDFKWTWTGLAGATVLLVSALIYGYFRLEDRQVSMDTTLTRIETRLDDLLQRVPPSPLISPNQTSPQRR